MKTISQINEELHCDCMTIKKFASYVKRRVFIPYDGFGYYHDGENETEIKVSFDYDDIMSHVKEYPYVCWYNK